MGVVLYQDINFGGWSFPVGDGQNVPVIPPPYQGQASSMNVVISDWVTLWESPNYNQGDDQFWIQSPGPGKYWSFNNLHTVWRPHGNNHWGDRIKGVSYSGGPTGDNDNRVILYADGHWGGNLGLLAFIDEKQLIRMLRDSIILKEGTMPEPSPQKHLTEKHRQERRINFLS